MYACGVCLENYPNSLSLAMYRVTRGIFQAFQNYVTEPQFTIFYRSLQY